MCLAKCIYGRSLQRDKVEAKYREIQVSGGGARDLYFRVVAYRVYLTICNGVTDGSPARVRVLKIFRKDLI